MMRRAAVVLALLLCLQWTWAQTDGENKNAEVLFESRSAEATPDQSRTNVTPDIWAKLKELRHKMEKLEQENAGAAQIHVTFITGINYFRELSIASFFVLCEYNSCMGLFLFFKLQSKCVYTVFVYWN